MSNLLYRCQRSGKQHPLWSYNAVVYELNIRQFTPSGTLAEAVGEMVRLRELGVNLIWIMPIFPIGELRRKGSGGSYYSIKDYRAVNAEFGTMEDFCALVDQAHRLGMRVILDWVANHTARDARWTVEHPDWYEWDEALGEIVTPYDWDDTAKLDFSNCQMQDEMVRSMEYWIEQADIDGFRCDMAMLVPIEFWNMATHELTDFMRARGRELFMLAEAEGEVFHRHAFDATYTWELHHLFNKIAQGQANAYALGERLAHENTLYDSSAFRLLFTSNHDENSWNGSEWTRMGAAAPTFAALTFVLSGIPLIYNGQEVALGRALAFFERDPIEWSELRTNDLARRVEERYIELCALKHTHKALRAGDRGGDIYTIQNSEPWRIFAIKRSVGDSVVIALFNLSDTDANVEFHDEDFAGEYSQIGSAEKAVLYSAQNFMLPAWSYFIYYK